MSFFIAYLTADGSYRAINRHLYPTKRDAELRAAEHPQLKIMDADHEPGRSILKERHGFS